MGAKAEGLILAVMGIYGIIFSWAIPTPTSPGKEELLAITFVIGVVLFIAGIVWAVIGSK